MAPRFRTIIKGFLAVAAVVGVLGTLPAEAVPVIRFDQFTDSGMLEYNSVGGTLKGTGIGFDLIVATDTPLNAGGHGCLGCTLNFETAANVTTGPVFWEWAPGGTFTITGQVPAANINTDTVLLSGSFTLATAVGAVVPSGNDIVVFTGLGIDTKDGDLLDFFGLSAVTFRFASTDISSLATINGDGTFSGDVTEADVTNTAPEPGSTLLLLLGLGSLAAYRRRRS